jgi:hypothetical protein
MKGVTMELRDLEKAARRQGWKVDRTTKGHPRFTPKDPTIQAEVFSGTPSDWRAIHNFLAALKRKGFLWPPPQGKGKKRKGS